MNKFTRIFCITHEQDVDGLFCGAILKNTFRNTLVFLTNHSYENMKKAADVLERNVAQSKRFGTVVFSDLSLNNTVEADIIGRSCLNAKQRGWEIVWLDHHNWNEEIIKRVQSFAKLILSAEHEQKCAAELVYNHFAKGRTACRRAAELAHIIDFRLPGVQQLPPLAEIIAYYRIMSDNYTRLQHIIDNVSKGIYWNDDLQEEYDKKYLPLKEEALLSAFKSLSLHNIGNYVIAVAQSQRLLAKSVLAERIFTEKPDAVIVVLFSPDGKISIRRRPGEEDTIRCDLIASKLNGGGHGYAAGAIITKRNYNDGDYSNHDFGINSSPLQKQDVVQALQSVLGGAST
ncbi:MAG: DHHA1 domain-containing protein [Thermoproteota archaeon]|nr:DHHA1 domain-containing protein [Thermoproteota archaeon]